MARSNCCVPSELLRGRPSDGPEPARSDEVDHAHRLGADRGLDSNVEHDYGRSLTPEKALHNAALVERTPERIWMMVLGAGIAVGIMSLIYVASRGGMGDGDVRLSPLLGAYLGWLNPGLVPVGLFFGFACGAVVGVGLVMAKRGDLKTAVPFGPFLALGTVLAIFHGQRYIDFILVR